jgi:Restriction endonuclease S subunits
MTNKKNKLIPKLRFPEFENDGEWENVSIENVGNVVTGNTPSKKESSFWGGNNIWITAQDFKGKYIYDSVLKLTNEGREKVRIIPKNSVLVTCIASIGLNGINKVECSTNQQINSIICNSSYSYNFVYYAIESNLVRLKRFAGQTAVPIITKSAFEKFNILTPPSLEEQQKIANCLSSLDELIEAQEEKLKLLKEHKKGLMQQLFPQANDNRDITRGGNLPKLRFPEFINDGAWEEKTLGEVCNITNGKSNAQDHIEGGKYPLFDRSEVIKTSNEYIFDTEAVIIPGEGMKFIPKYYEGKFNLHQRAYALKGFSIHGKFIYYSMLNNNVLLSRKAVQSTVLSLRLPILQNFPVQVPKQKKEQQKIADCLSSLDETIEAQDQKIELLKQHKKGLMQGLFPVIN